MNQLKTMSIFSVLVMSLILSSCATYKVFSDISDTKTKTVSLLKDEFIAITKPSKPIQNHEDAVVFVGKKHTFLVKELSPTAFAPVNFSQIFEHADLNYLYIENNAIGLDKFVKSVHEGVIPKPRKIDLHASGKESKYTHGFYLKFIKPKNKVQKGEKQTMQALGMACLDDYENYLVCYRSLTAEFILVQNPQNMNQVKYGLKQPLAAEIYHNESIERKVKPEYLLMPLTIAFDIVTFPVQFIMLQNASWN